MGLYRSVRTIPPCYLTMYPTSCPSPPSTPILHPSYRSRPLGKAVASAARQGSHWYASAARPFSSFNYHSTDCICTVVMSQRQSVLCMIVMDWFLNDTNPGRSHAQVSYSFAGSNRYGRLSISTTYRAIFTSGRLIESGHIRHPCHRAEVSPFPPPLSSPLPAFGVGSVQSRARRY